MTNDQRDRFRELSESHPEASAKEIAERAVMDHYLSRDEIEAFAIRAIRDDLRKAGIPR